MMVMMVFVFVRWYLIQRTERRLMVSHQVGEINLLTARRMPTAERGVLEKVLVEERFVEIGQGRVVPLEHGHGMDGRRHGPGAVVGVWLGA